MKNMKQMLAGSVLLAAAAAEAANPVVWTKFTADPAPMVDGDTVYLYTTHDEDDATGFKMRDWLLYTTKDMVNWTDCGAVASLKDFKWYGGDNGAWAEQVIKRDGKWFMYCPIHGHGIGVLTADSPFGPFTDPIGKPLVWQREHWDDIDPTVMIDDDGQAYMYWGNPNLYHVKLNRDMISTSGEIVKHPKVTEYQEGPWLFKRGLQYYLAFASTCCPEGIGYATSVSPTGPWDYKGAIMPHSPRSNGNHPGIIEFKGKWYVFGLNYDLYRLQLSQQGKPFKHAERRSVAADELRFRPDGMIETNEWWSKDGVAQVGRFDPYTTVKAVTMAKAEWVKTRRDARGQIVLTQIHDGDYVMVQGVDLKGGAASIAYTAQPRAGGTVELRLDSPTGLLIGTVEVKGDAQQWQTFTAALDSAKASGVHDLYFTFHGKAGVELFDADSWSLTAK